MKPRSKMMTLIEQVLDEIMLAEGLDTEITVASIRANWDSVHPTAPVPSPGTVRNNLDQLCALGKLRPLPGGKSWTFSEPEVKEDETMKETKTASTPAVSDEWVEVLATPRPTPREQSDVTIRINPFGKIPTVSIRIKETFAPSGRVRVYRSKKGNKMALEFVKSGGRKLGNYDKKAKSTLITRLTGQQAEEFIEGLEGLRLPHTFRFDGDEIKKEGNLYVVTFRQE